MKEFVISEAKVETAILVGLITQTQDERKTKEYLDELEFLAQTAGAEVVRRFTQKLPCAHSVTYVGKGKLEEIRDYIRAEEEEEREIGMVIFDDELSGPYIADSRYLCDARSDSQCQDSGGIGSIQVYVATLAAPLDPLGTSGGWCWCRWR